MKHESHEKFSSEVNEICLLESLAMSSLDVGRNLMEAGAGAKSVEKTVEMFALGLGAERVDLRIGYASLAITVGIGSNAITRMRKIGHLSVNQRLDQEFRHFAKRVASREFTLIQAQNELRRISERTPSHSSLVVAIAVGLACAAFGRLLDVDWAGTGPVLIAAVFGQLIRRELLVRHVNIFICTAFVSFLSSVIGGLGAYWLGSGAVSTAMIASILLLVPGVPAMNAQRDILEGHPTLGSARAITVGMSLIFIAAGLWIGQICVKHIQ